jgi:hypothetical protein
MSPHPSGSRAAAGRVHLAAAPLTLSLGDEPAAYLLLLGLLLLLFLARVAGQVVAAVAAPLWLPPHRAWYSGVMPYRYLLPAQLAILVIMFVAMTTVGGENGSSAVRRPGVGEAALWFSYAYAVAMAVRLTRWLASPPERRGVLIPIIFHFVLAAFLFVFGSWHGAARG